MHIIADGNTQSAQISSQTKVKLTVETMNSKGLSFFTFINTALFIYVRLKL